jgi:hypothetical protein
MHSHRTASCASLICVLCALPLPTSLAAASAEEAARLKTTLMPLGGEKAGNANGSIPAWTGGLTPSQNVTGPDGRRTDPFASEKPLFSINAKNVDQYGDKVTEGVKRMMQKYPAFRIDVYPTHRTAMAPQYVYDNTFKNATNAKLVDGPAGPMPSGAHGGVPFPIAKTGIEVMWNHILRWRPPSWRRAATGYMMTTEGRWVKSVEGVNDEQAPYYFPEGSAESIKGDYILVRVTYNGPPIRAGEAIVGRLNIEEDKTTSWVYLAGQRRVRKLPLSCCDTPTPFSAGVVTFDEVETFTGRLDRFDWKLVGKREVFIPYNTNRIMLPAKASDVLMAGHLNPDHVRWELHRVWVVEATLREGQRHVVSKARYYVDEDSWLAALGERYDARGQLWRVPFSLPIAMPDLPGILSINWGSYDLIGGTSYVGALNNEHKDQGKMTPRHPDNIFTPAGLTGESLR